MLRNFSAFGIALAVILLFEFCRVRRVKKCAIR